MLTSDPHWFDIALYVWLGLAVVVFIVLVVLKLEVPYGRYTRTGWGAFIGNRAGWVLMEFPSLVIFGALFLGGKEKHDAVTWIFFAVWVFHYINRSLIYPFRIRTFSKKMPLSVMFMGIFFNLINASANGYYLGFLQPQYPEGWWKDIRFILGAAVYLFGVITNWSADGKLIGLRKNGGSDYAIPYGGLFRYVSCPNYLGEMMEWSGFALMAWNLPALAFAAWTFANLVPRALVNHAWYHRTFPDYPKERKALIPFLF